MNTQAVVRLELLVVHGLFGGGAVPLSLDPELTILTGENGSGKSTILQVLRAFGTQDWGSLAALPIEGIELLFSDGASFTATVSEDFVQLSSSLSETPVEAIRTQRLADIGRDMDFLRHRLARSTSGAEKARIRSQMDHLRTRGRMLAPDEAHAPELEAYNDEISSRLRTKFISARRLERALAESERYTDEEGRVSVVDAFAGALAERMKTTLSRYATESQEQEKILPSKIVRAMLNRAPGGAEEIATEVDELRQSVQELAESLTRVGLFEEEEAGPEFLKYPRNDVSVMLAIREVYRVTLSRLQRLTALRSELELFADFVNRRFYGKRIALNQRSGIEVVLPDRTAIRPSQLSSGEQQLLAIAYELLFETEERALVLLDEPELSLHVAWLQGLLAAFLAMGDAKALQFLVATHSGNVLAGYQDHERSLDELRP